jgi:hypothetical protein
MKFETYIIISIAAIPIARAVIMKVEIFMSVDSENIYWWDQMKCEKVTDTYILLWICFARMDFSEQSRIEVEAWSPFRAKHINDSIIIKDLVRRHHYKKNRDIMFI